MLQPSVENGCIACAEAQVDKKIAAIAASALRIRVADMDYALGADEAVE